MTANRREVGRKRFVRDSTKGCAEMVFIVVMSIIAWNVENLDMDSISVATKAQKVKIKVKIGNRIIKLPLF